MLQPDAGELHQGQLIIPLLLSLVQETCAQQTNENQFVFEEKLVHQEDHFKDNFSYEVGLISTRTTSQTHFVSINTTSQTYSFVLEVAPGSVMIILICFCQHAVGASDA